MMMVLDNHGLWRHMLLVIISGEMLSGSAMKTAWFCSNKVQTFNVTTLKCQQTYKLVNVSLEWKRTACDQKNLYINHTPHAANKCYNSSLELITDGIRNISGCESWCTNEFSYQYQNQFPRVEELKKQCCENRTRCNAEQIWLYYKCDGDEEAGSSASPDNKNSTRSLARSPNSSVTVITQTATSEYFAETVHVSSTRNPVPRKDSFGTSTETIPTQVLGEDHPHIVYIILSVVIVSLCVTIVVIIIVCRRKIKARRNAQGVPVDRATDSMNANGPNVRMVSDLATPSDSHSRHGTAPTDAGCNTYEMIRESMMGTSMPPTPGRGQSPEPRPDAAHDHPVLADSAKSTSGKSTVGARRVARTDDYCLATKDDPGEAGAFSVSDDSTYTVAKKCDREEDEDETLLVDNETYGSK